jgi:hypothetical protein
MSIRKSAVHFTRGSRKVLCGIIAKSTLTDTRVKAKVTCRNCRRVLRAEAKP